MEYKDDKLTLKKLIELSMEAKEKDQNIILDPKSLLILLNKLQERSPHF